MRVVIQPDHKMVGKWTARYIASKINMSQVASRAPFVLGLPTGSTPLTVYKELIDLCKEGKVSFANVITFNMDEYVGLPREHPESYWTFMHENLFKYVDIKPEHINMLDGNAPDLDYEAIEYEYRIKEAGGIDIFLGGVGTDGHIAFNEPFSSLTSQTRVKTLNMESIISNSRFFDDDITKVPKQAITVGVKTIMDAKEVIIMATGMNKANAVQQMIEGAYSAMFTASALQLHPKGVVVCDTFATYQLKVASYHHFLDAEAGRLDPESIKL